MTYLYLLNDTFEMLAVGALCYMAASIATVIFIKGADPVWK